MRYLDYKESRVHNTQDLPLAYYHVTQQHPRYQMVEHWHTECELIRVLKGTLALTINGIAYKGVPGSIFFISEGMIHGGMPAGCVYECLVFDPNLIIEGSPLASRAMEPLLHGAVQVQKSFDPADTEVAELVGQVMCAVQQQGTGFELLLLGNIYRLFAAIQQRYVYTDMAKNAHAQQLARLKNVLRYIRAHYNEQVSLDSLAACAHMNKRYFCRYFREMTQKTPIEYLNYYRIECACEQLGASEKSVSEIALACGFNDISYFIRVFKKHKGVTPLQYTKKAPGPQTKGRPDRN